MFITESMRTFAPSAAFLISSAACWSGVVGACITSNPTSRAIFMRSAKLSLAGSISRRTPFLIGKGAEDGVASALRDAGESAKSSPMPDMLSPVEQAAVTVVFRNSRREELHIHTSEVFEFRHSTLILSGRPAAGIGSSEKQRSKIATSPQLIQVNLRIPHLGGLQVFVPGNLVSLVRSGARHHAGQGGFGALGGLIVEITAGNAFDKRFLFLGVRELEVGSETSGDREFLGLRRIFGGRASGLPGFVAPDAQRTRVRRL